MNQVIVEFNKRKLNELIDITRVDRSPGVNKSISSSSRKNKKGVDFLGVSSEVYKITVDFRIKYDVTAKKRKLADWLNVDESKELSFSDESDKVYYGVPSSISLEGLEYGATGTIVWEIPDGVAYSKDSYTFTNEAIEQNKRTSQIKITNPGTEPMDLELTAYFKSDNGFLGLQNEDKSTVVLFGSIHEIDGFSYESSEVLFDDHFTKDKGWTLNKGIVPPVTGNPLQTGSVEYKVDPFQSKPIDENEGFVSPKDYGQGEEWHGPSITKEVGVDSSGLSAKNWKATWRFDFNTSGTGDGKQVGHNSVTFVDQNNSIICSVVIEDNNPQLERSDIAFYVGNERVWDTRNTTLFYTTQRPNKGNVMVEKIGNQISFLINYANIKKTFQTINVDSELKKITWYGAKFKTYPQIHNNLLRAISVIKHNVNNWVDIPNKFSAGDTLIYGKKEKNIYCTINELQGLQLRDPGSTIITAPPGESTLTIAYSDFSETPEITLTGRAKYV